MENIALLSKRNQANRKRNGVVENQGGMGKWLQPDCSGHSNAPESSGVEEDSQAGSI